MVVPPFIAAVASTRPLRPAVARDRALPVVGRGRRRAGLFGAGLHHRTAAAPLRARAPGGRWHERGLGSRLDRAGPRSGDRRARWLEPPVDRPARERALGPAGAPVRVPHDRARRSAPRRSTWQGSRPGPSRRARRSPSRPSRAARASSVAFVLPAGVTPARSSLPGGDAARALDRHLHRPAGGRHRLARHFAAKDAGRLREIRIAVTDFGFAGRPRLAAAARLAAAGSRGLDRQRDLDPARRRPAARRFRPLVNYVKIRNRYVDRRNGTDTRVTVGSTGTSDPAWPHVLT